MGGGNEPKQAKAAILDAAERSLTKHGYRASTMDVIAREAGYTRTIVYRHFATRKDLIEALVKRSTLRHISRTVEQQDRSASFATSLVEGFVIVATKLAHDPLYTIFTEPTETGTVADLLINSAPFINLVEKIIVDGLKADGGSLRKGIRAIDAAKFVVGQSLSFLLGIAPSSDNPDQVRRYVTAFILPAIMANPPPASSVFEPL